MEYKWNMVYRCWHKVVKEIIRVLLSCFKDIEMKLSRFVVNRVMVDKW